MKFLLNIVVVMACVFMIACEQGPTSSSSSAPEGMQSRALVSVPSEMVGWGPTYCWMNLSVADTETLAVAMESAGLNIVPLELFGFEQDTWHNRIPELLALFDERASIYNAHGIMIDLKVVNWNWGTAQLENGKMLPCDSRLSDAWFQDLLTALTPYQEMAILQACVEWSSISIGAGCLDKAKRWCDMSAVQWAGLKSWNQGSRPGSAPAGYILDWHVAHPGVLGARNGNKIVTTDTSTILNKLGGLSSHLTNHEELAKLVKACRAHGSGFSGYTFFNALDMTADLAAIEVIGKAWQGL